MNRVIREADASGADAMFLMRALDAELQERYPGAIIHSIDPVTFSPSGGVFLIAYEDDRPVACGALRAMADGSLEVKRMFVLAAARRRGHARAVLAALEARAMSLHVPVVRLETGDRQPEAVHLYESAGYRPIPSYGEYAGSPHSRCFEKRLQPVNRIL